MFAPADLSDAAAVIDVLQTAATLLEGQCGRVGSRVHLPEVGRLLATGDLHDNPIHLAKIIAAARLDDCENHVVLHELIHGDHLINGMDFSYRMLVRVADLVVRYPDQVHPLLANHELAQLTGRGVSKGGGNSVELFEEAVAYVFPDRVEEVLSAVGHFMAAFPLAVSSAGGVLCAHSIPSPLGMKRFDPAVLDRPLQDEDRLPPDGDAYLMVWGRRYDEAVVESLATAWDVRLLCLGHEKAESGVDWRAGRVLVLNSDHEHAAVLPLNLEAIPDPQDAMLRVIRLSALPMPE